MTTVLMTADAVGGVWTYALQLAATLAERDVTVELAVMGPAPSGEQLANAKQAAVRSVHVGDFPLEWMDEPWAGVDEAGAWLLALAEAIQPDIVHLNGYVHADLPWSAPSVVVAHSCVVSWWEAVHGADAPARYDEYRHRVRRGLAAADAVVAPTAAMLRLLQRHYDFDGGGVIPNGCRPLPGSVGCAKEPLVVGAGRVWDQAKNLAALDRVAARVPWPVALAGSYSSPSGDSEWASEGAQLLGRLESAELGALLGRASVFALPARYEPFGLGPLEAALAGCALVLGDIESLREVWADAALYVPPDDDDALVSTLENLASSPRRVTALATAARERAATLSHDAMAARYLELYHALTVERTGVAACG